MALIEQIELTGLPDADTLWRAVAHHVLLWLAGQGLPARDAVVLLPFAALLSPARRAMAAAGGWLPRVETPLTLAASLGPPPAVLPGDLSGDPVLDKLMAADLLRQQAWAAERERDDRRAFTHTVELLVDAAHALRGGALARAPADRPAYWALARELCVPSSGPGAYESLLLRAGLEWAERGSAGLTDGLFGLRPSAWIVVRIGGRDRLAEALPAATACPTLLIDLDAVPDSGSTTHIERWLCVDREQEAWAAASQVVAALNADRVPVALVALDRQLARRVRALLHRVGVTVADETGWALSATAAAAMVMAQLHAAAEQAADARLEWLKSWPPARDKPRALEALEARWRGARAAQDSDAADALWHRAQEHLARWTSEDQRPLTDWLVLLVEQLTADGTVAALQADAAGVQLLQALCLDRDDLAWRATARAARLDLPAFIDWLARHLEAARFVPPAPDNVQVVLTPLARAIGRPFAQVILPGADANHLGAIEPVAALIGERVADALELDGRAARRERQRRAFAQLLRVPAFTLLRRGRDADEALAPSPEVETLALARANAGRPLAREQLWQPLLQLVPALPQGRPQPAAPDHLPERLSASSIEALRACPYRFFTRAVLRLSDADELDAEVEKRDYGNWLHGVLYRFHKQRQPGQDDAAGLIAAADAHSAEQQLDAALWLPYRAGFESFAATYLTWLHKRDAAGWQWVDGEVPRDTHPPGWQPQRLHGVIDRLDRAIDGSLQVIDYKTGAVPPLREKARDPLEDTQLAVYAALEPQARSALYLALDEARAPEAIQHQADVAATAAVLVQEVGREMARLRAGAPLPALGEGAVCDFCEARGLCRRDHWAAQP
jgi:ATP-dependent helicase/nuclease subunit B